MQSGRTQRFGCPLQIIIAMLVLCVSFPCFVLFRFVFVFFRWDNFHGTKSQPSETQIGLLRAKIRANGRTEAEGRVRGEWNNIICAVTVIICRRNKWLRPVGEKKKKKNDECLFAEEDAA